MRLRAWLRHLRVPLAGAPLIFVVTVSLLAWVALAAGWAGVPLLVMVSCWAWSYAYRIVEHVARGQAPPVFSAEMANPWHEPRPLLHLLVGGAVAGLVWWLADSSAPWLALCVASLALALLPASLASLAVDGDLAHAVWPPTLLAIARGLGLLYAAVWIVGVGVAWLVAASAPHLPRLLALALVQIALFAWAAALGGALYECRTVLGIDAWESPERRAEAAAKAAERDRDEAVAEAYALLRVRKPAAAWQRLGAALGPGPPDPEAYRWLRDRSAQWSDRQFADRLTAELVARLIALGRRGEALIEVEGWWQRGGEFTACTARDLDILKSVAATLGHAEAGSRLAGCAVGTARGAADGSTERCI